MSPSRLLSSLVVLALVGLLAPASASATSAASAASAVPVVSPGEPALGSPSHLAPAGKGWGKVAPHHLFNGGDPSGEVARIAWRHWGGSTAKGRGYTWLLRPGGGYYARPGRIVLRAEALGACPDGTAAYTRLEFRVAHRPGGPVGQHWRAWAGDGDIC